MSANILQQFHRRILIEVTLSVIIQSMYKVIAGHTDFVIQGFIFAAKSGEGIFKE